VYTTLQKQELGRDFSGEANRMTRVENDLTKKAYVLPWLEHLTTALKQLGKLTNNFEGAL
jgi:arsenite-transporting ATPase